MKQMTIVLAVLTFALFAASTAFAGPGQPAECPDSDGDGICNGQDPDYVPGDRCFNFECPNPDCPDADGNGICNGQDPDYVPGGAGPNRFGMIETLAVRLAGLVALLGPVF